MTKAGKRTYGKTLATAKTIADPKARALFLETELERVDKPAKLVDALLEALKGDDDLPAKLVTIAHAHPRRFAVLDAIGAKLIDANELDEARIVLELAAAAGSRSVETHYMLGRILLLRNEPAAVTALERVLEIDPGYTKARIYLATWFVDRDPRRALDLLVAIDLSFAAELRGMALEKLGRTDAAAVAFADAIAEFGDEIEARRAFASWHASERRYARARPRARPVGPAPDDARERARRHRQDRHGDRPGLSQ